MIDAQEVTNIARSIVLNPSAAHPTAIRRLALGYLGLREALLAWWDDPDNPPPIAAQLARERREDRP